jgi:hypothetical protein
MWSPAEQRLSLVPKLLTKMLLSVFASSSIFVAEGKMTEKETAAKERKSKVSLWKTWYQPNVKIHRIWKSEETSRETKGYRCAQKTDLHRITYRGSARSICPLE